MTLGYRGLTGVASAALSFLPGSVPGYACTPSLGRAPKMVGDCFRHLPSEAKRNAIFLCGQRAVTFCAIGNAHGGLPSNLRFPMDRSWLHLPLLLIAGTP